MAWSGGKTSGVGEVGADHYFIPDGSEQEVVNATYRLIQQKSGSHVLQVSQLRLNGMIGDYIRWKESLGLYDGFAGFASTFLLFTEKADGIVPAELGNEFRAYLERDALKDVPLETRRRWSLVREYSDLALKFMREGKPKLAAQAHRAAAVAAEAVGFPRYLSVLERIFNLARSDVERVRRYGEGFLAAAFPPEAGTGILSSQDFTSSLLETEVLNDEELARWGKFLQLKIGEIIKGGIVVPSDINAYASQALRQFKELVLALIGPAYSAANSLQLLSSKGGSELTDQFIKTLSRDDVELKGNTYALLHVAAAQEVLSPQRIRLIENVLYIINTVSRISSERLPNHILPLEIAYLGIVKPDDRVDGLLAELLGRQLHPFIRQVVDGRAIVGNFDGLLEINLVDSFLRNLAHRGGAPDSIAAQLLEMASTRDLDKTQIAFMMRALYHDVMESLANPENHKALLGYMGVLRAWSPEVAKSFEAAGIDSTMELLAKYAEKEKNRGGGKGGSGEKSGPVSSGGTEPPVPPTSSMPPPSGQTKSASSGITKSKLACLVDGAAALQAAPGSNTGTVVPLGASLEIGGTLMFK